MNKIKILSLVVLFLFSLDVFALKDVRKFKIRSAPKSLETFAYQFQDILTHGEKSFLSESVSMNGVVDVAVEVWSQNFSDAYEISQMRSLLNGFSQNKMKDTLVSQFPSSADWNYIHHRMYKRNHYLTFYVEFGGGEYEEYVEFEVVNRNDNWVITDWYFYSTDIWGTEAAKRAIELLVRSQKNISSEELSSIGKIFSLVKKRNNVKAIFRELPEAFKKDHFVQGVVFRAMLNMPEEERMSLLKTVLPYTGKSDFLHLKSNYYYAIGEYEKGLFYFQKFNKAVGGYYEIGLVEAELFFRLGKKDKGVKVLAGLIEKNDVVLVYATALILLARENQFDVSVQVLDVLKTGFDHVITTQDLAEVEGMSAFLESSVYQEWESLQ